MIFVTLGTQRFQFDRVLKKLDELLEEGKLKKEELKVQCVYSEYVPKNFECFKLKPQDEIDRINQIMCAPIPWAPGLLLNADGFISPYYTKD